MDRLDAHRTFFADLITTAAGKPNTRVNAAFRVITPQYYAISSAPQDGSLLTRSIPNWRVAQRQISRVCRTSPSMLDQARKVHAPVSLAL